MTPEQNVTTPLERARMRALEVGLADIGKTYDQVDTILLGEVVVAAALEREEIARTITKMCDAGVLIVKSGNPWRPDSEKKTALFIADAIIAGILGGNNE